MIFDTHVEVRDLAGTASPVVVTRDGKGNPTQIVTTYTSIVVTETITRDPITGFGTSKTETITDAP